MVGRRSCNPLFWTRHSCRKNGLLVRRIVDNRSRSAKLKKSRTGWAPFVGPKWLSSLIRGAFGPEMTPQTFDRTRITFHPKFTLCRA
jgi:hypothetical protein